ncbi:hypothetical protein D0Z03_000572 [Geotrichum reessii]|nr:hypothetical protein D0Z03_000572 [Galactomyces reessii]
MSAYSTQSYYPQQGPAAANPAPTASPTTHAPAQPNGTVPDAQSNAPSTSVHSTPVPATAPNSGYAQPPHQHDGSPVQPGAAGAPIPTGANPYYYPHYAQQQSQQPQQQHPYYPASTTSVVNTATSTTAPSMYYPSGATTDMPYGAYPPQYQYPQQAYQAAYVNGYSMQPYQYVHPSAQAQQQQQQQAIYQQQYQQHAYHHQQQSLAMVPTITDPTGQNPPPNIKPKITTTLWEDEGTLCFQVEARGICVARREDNNLINGTKLLNVAGMTRGRRDGILKGEKKRHVVKAGAMHLKGVWIPYERALEFANREKITDMLYPLFVTDLKALLYHPANFARTAQVLSAAEKRKAEFQKAAAAKETKNESVGANTNKSVSASPKNTNTGAKKKESATASPQPSQQSLSGRFSVDKIVSQPPQQSQQSQAPQAPQTQQQYLPLPMTATPPPSATGGGPPKPYYYDPQQQQQPPQHVYSPNSRIATPQPGVDGSYQQHLYQRYPAYGMPPHPGQQGQPIMHPMYQAPLPPPQIQQQQPLQQPLQQLPSVDARIDGPKAPTALPKPSTDASSNGGPARTTTGSAEPAAEKNGDAKAEDGKKN